MCPIFLCGLLEFSQFFDGICLPSSRLLTTCVCPISRMCPNFQIGHICIKRSSNRTHVDVSCSSSEYPYEICTHVVNTLDPASATSRLQSLRAILLSLATPHPTPPPTPHSHSEPRQTLDTLRRGKVFRMAWGGGGGGLTCVRGVSVCVCGGGGHIFACTSGREGWGCTAARATLDIHRHEVLDEFFSVPSDEAVALHGTLRLHNATYVHAKR